MDNRSNMLQLCRLCLVKDDVNIPIFEEHGDIRQIFLKITSCLPVKVSRDDKLPKKICDGCSYKLETLYEFWNTSVNAEKQLLAWLGEAGMNSEMADGTITAVAQQIKPTDTFVKQETVDPPDVHSEDHDQKDYVFQQKFESASAGPSATVTSNEEEEPPPKRARRTAAVKAAIAMDRDSDDDDDSGEPITKVEDESEESDGEDHTFADAPSTSADDQPGPSGVGKDGVDAPCVYQDHLYSTNFSLDALNTPLQLPSFLDLVSCQKQPTLSENMMETSVVDQLNDSDELMNLLSTEENCTAILQNISTNEQFQRLMNEESEFVPTEEIEQLINKSCELQVSPVVNIIDSRVIIPKKVVPEEIHNFTKNTERPANNEDRGTKNKGSFKCDQCEKVCSTRKLLKKHSLTHTKQREFPCEVCGKLFRHRYEVTAHLRSHSKPTYQCEMCPQMFIHKSHLNGHRKKHLGEFVAFCEDCRIGFPTSTAFKRHRNIHHDKSYFICDHCGAQLSSLCSLKEHKRTHDPNYGKDRSYACDTCGKKFLTSRNLKSHIKIHSKSSLYNCSICGKSVSSKIILETHLKMHTGVKDFSCTVCNKNFASKEYLVLHHRTHSGEKPFECTICGKRFTQKTSLTVHIRFHTGERPYKCECGKQFATKSHLMAHYKTHDIGGVDIEYITNHLI